MATVSSNLYVLKLYSNTSERIFDLSANYLVCHVPTAFIEDKNNKRLYIMATVSDNHNRSAYNVTDPEAKIVGYIVYDHYYIGDINYINHHIKGQNIIFDGEKEVNSYKTIKNRTLTCFHIAEAVLFSEELYYKTFEKLCYNFSASSNKLLIFSQGTDSHALLSLWSNRFEDTCGNNFSGNRQDVIAEFRSLNNHTCGTSGSSGLGHGCGGHFSSVKRLLRMR